MYSLQSLHFINSNLFKKWKQNHTDFLQKCTDFIKIKRTLVIKGIFSETAYVCTKLQVYSLILTSFREGFFTLFPQPPPPPTHTTTTTLKRTPKKHTKIRVKAYNIIWDLRKTFITGKKLPWVKIFNAITQYDEHDSGRAGRGRGHISLTFNL